MNEKEIEEIIKSNDTYVYHLRIGEMSLREFEEFQSQLQHYKDWPIAGGLGLKKNFELHIDAAITLPIRIVPFAWSAIKLEE